MPDPIDHHSGTAGGDFQKVALITGGSSGLGLAMANRLAAGGYTPIILARNETRIDSAVTQLRERAPSAAGFSCDVRSPAQLKQTAESIRNQFGSIDFLILNAGELRPALLQDLEGGEKVIADIESNLIGAVRSTHAFLPLIRPDSKVLFISSGFGLIGAAGYAPYCAAKAGIIGFAESLRRETLVDKLSIYVACPADIDTPQHTAEVESMPAWMQNSKVRNTAISPDLAAERILKKCRGNRFLILIDPRLRLLRFAGRIFPESWIRAYLDRAIPRPA